MKKQAKKVYSFRLSEQTKLQLENMADCEQMSEGEIIEWAINKFYNVEFRSEKPELPDIRIKNYSL